MSKLEDILKKSDNDLNDIVESLLKQIRIVEPKLFNSIVGIFDYMDIKGFMISQETHKDQHKHLHVALWLDKTLWTTDEKFFDFVCK